MDYIDEEIDIFQRRICPFNVKHQIAENQFSSHVSNCPDRSSNVLVCPHCPEHYFTLKQFYDYHVPRCFHHPNRQSSIKAETDFLSNFKRCIYNSLHKIKKNFLEQHLQTCISCESNKFIEPNFDVKVEKINIDISQSFELPKELKAEQIKLVKEAPSFTKKYIQIRVSQRGFFECELVRDINIPAINVERLIPMNVEEFKGLNKLQSNNMTDVFRQRLLCEVKLNKFQSWHNQQVANALVDDSAKHLVGVDNSKAIYDEILVIAHNSNE